MPSRTVHREPQGEADLVKTDLPISLLLGKCREQGFEVPAISLGQVGLRMIRDCLEVLYANGGTRIHEHLGREAGRVVRHQLRRKAEADEDLGQLVPIARAINFRSGKSSTHFVICGSQVKIVALQAHRLGLARVAGCRLAA